MKLIDRESERGATAILVAFSLVLLFLFAAVAIDAAGFGFNERRQAQSAADVGSLAAVQFAVPQNLGNSACTGLSGISLSLCNGAVEAMEVANATLDDPSLADWADASRCATPPAGYTVSPVTACVAFTSSNQRAWVRIPTIERPTTFARVAGFDTVSVSADAIASADISGVVGKVLPFLVPGVAAATDYNCLKTGPNPNWGACEDLPATGNFGSMDFFMYGNATLGYTASCAGGTNARLVTNIARGIDHPLGLHPTGNGGGRYETTHCPDWNAQPNMVQGQPGVGSNLEEGMLYGSNAYTNPTVSYRGRIQVSSGGKLVRNSGGPKAAARVDDVPLWAYLSTSSSLNGTACDDAVVDTPALMVACISWAKANSQVVFNENLAGSIRFGFTPEVWEWDFENPSHWYYIKGFLPVYIDTTMFGCNNNRCTIMYTPGVADSGNCPNNPPVAEITCGTPGSHNSGLEAVTAYILSRDIVPDNAKSPAPGDPNQRAFSLIE